MNEQFCESTQTIPPKRAGLDDSGGDDAAPDDDEMMLRVVRMSHEEKESYREQFPSRNTFHFLDGTLRVTSDFDAGNLSKCVLTN